MEASTLKFAWLCIIFPFIGVLAIPLMARISKFLRNAVAVGFPLLAAACSLMILPNLWHPENLPLQSSLVWLRNPFLIECGVLLDPLSIILAVVVAIISAIITVYCLGYMRDDPGINRFLMLVNLFIGSMLLLVLANNLVFLFIGWKLVGLCSYALIGFYYQDEKKYWIGGPPPTPMVKPTYCGLKALVVTGFGDLVMLGGILIIFYYSRTLNLLELYHTTGSWFPLMAKQPGMVALVTILLLAGPVGKSAQFPLHEWLPEAMAGPGPVSALIHAATMVKSGVYLVARLIPIFYYGYWVAGCHSASYFFVIVAWIGAITAFVAATQGLVALELKKALAYSTISQIGYMWIGLGVAGLTEATLVNGCTSGIFHLMSHALFKACLFLCAGSVIHAVHSIYMFDMGGMRKYMPYTWLFMIIAALCLMGLPPLPAFWSKDAILLTCLEAHNIPVFILAMITVALTAAYTVRFIGMTFYGPESKNIAHLREKNSPPHESLKSMWGACAILAFFIIILGIFGPKVEYLLKNAFHLNLVEHLKLPTAHSEHGAINYHLLVTMLSVASILAGAIPAYFLYIGRQWSITYNRASLLHEVHEFCWNRWYINGFYTKVFEQGTLKFARFVSEKIENPYDHLIHRVIPRLVTKGLPSLAFKLQTESENMLYVGAYIMIILVGALFIALL